MLKHLTRTSNDWSLSFLRVVLAAVLWPHGAQKALGWFGGYGFEGTMKYLTDTIGAPAPLAVLAIAVEFLGPAALAAGFLTRAVAAGVVGIMAVAVAAVHLPNGFFMNWSGAQAGEGFEYHILMAAIALVLLARGGGAGSVDGAVAGR